MSINFPGTIDVFTNPSGTSTLDSPDHAGQHSDANDAIEALEAAVGTTSGTGVLNDFTAGDFPVRQNASNVLQDTIANGTATALTIGTATVNQAFAGSAVLDEDDMASDSATALATQQSIKAYVDTYGNNDSIFRQALINGNFDIDQRVGPYTSGRNNDDVYTLDHWNLFSDGNDTFDVSQEAITDLPGSNYAIKLDVETAKRGGIVQFLEAKDAQKFKGKYVSVSFAVKSANISAIRAAVLSWGSTADAITSDVVDTWADTPTWAANWTAENTPADLTVTSSWTTVKIENIYVDSATVNNLALALWLPNEETIGDIIYITQVQMNEGSVALPFMSKSFAQELADCQRYFWKSFPYETAPAQAAGQKGSYITASVGTAVATLVSNIVFPVPMRTTPSMTSYSSDGENSNWFRADGNASVTAGFSNTSDKKTSIYNSSTTVDGINHVIHATASAEL